MYASLPSDEDSTSWGSGPAGTRPTILRDAGSTIASVLSPFSRMSRAVGGVCAVTQVVPTKNAARNRLDLHRAKTKRDFDLVMATPILAPRAWRAVAGPGAAVIGSARHRPPRSRP